MRLTLKVFLYGAMVLLPITLLAQSGGGKSPGGSAPASASGLAGLSFAVGDWDTKMPTGRDLVMLCYALMPTPAASLPFTLEPAPEIDKDSNDKKPPCKAIDATHPLLQRQTVILVIDARKAGNGVSRIKVLNINLTSTASTPINPAPLRPSMTTSSIAVQNAAKKSVYYFRWPVQLTGDTIPTLAVNAVYLGPPPGDAWAPDTVYAAGSVVTPAPGGENGHFYTATNEGRSGNNAVFTTVVPAQVSDGPAAASALTWVDLGTGTPPGGAAVSITSWSGGKAFMQGAVILNPLNGHYYGAMAGGLSGSTMPAFPVNSWLSVAENGAVVTWREVGKTAPQGSTPALWTANTYYKAGQAISGPKGHFYVVNSVGQSGATLPALLETAGAVIPDTASSLPQLKWTDLGTGLPQGVPPASIVGWAPANQFAHGTVILLPHNGHYYVASVGGVSGSVAPAFTVTSGSSVSEPPTGAITWEDMGTAAPGGSPTSLPQWTPGTYFATGQVISAGDNGHFYLARVGGQSGTAMPTFLINLRKGIPDGDIMWQDSGSVAPASVASAGPTDQVISLLPSFALPQVHSLYYFNLAAGFAVSSIRNPSFVRTLQPANGAGTAQYATQQVKGSLGAEPILLFTTYLPGLALDAESPWKPKNLIPGFSFGFSLSAPANSFYLGGSCEIWRNLQVAAGLNIAKTTTLAPGNQDPASSAAPTTLQRFAKGVFVGVTLNLDFIPGLFGAKL
jgi:hypothetical protein